MNLLSLSSLVGVLLVVTVGAVAAAARSRRGWWRARRGAAAPREELRRDLRAVLRATPARPPLLRATPSSPLSLHVEARLLSGYPQHALQEVEQELLQRPRDGEVFVALAKALLYCQQDDDARTAVQWALRLGVDDPELDYLMARLTEDAEEALRLALRACRREPAYGEALYLAARLALRLDLHEEGRRLLLRIAPLMTLSVERLAYQRDAALPPAAPRLRARLQRRWSQGAQHAPGEPG